MVKIQSTGEDDYARLDRVVREVVQEAAQGQTVTVDVTGWTRKTYDFYREDPRTERKRLLARVESFVTTNGEVQVFDEEGLPLARALAERIEKEFDIGEAVIVRK